MASVNTPSVVDDELVIIRTFDAPRAMVWKAWTDPEQLAQWMGPRGYRACHIEGDLRPGGAWKNCLKRDEDGEELWNGGVYREIKEPERIVYTFAWTGDDGRPENEMLITLTFAEHGGKTEMTLRQTQFRSLEQCDNHRGGWTSCFDRLEEYLAKATTAGK